MRLSRASVVSARCQAEPVTGSQHVAVAAAATTLPPQAGRPGSTSNHASRQHQHKQRPSVAAPAAVPQAHQTSSVVTDQASTAMQVVPSPGGVLELRPSPQQQQQLQQQQQPQGQADRQTLTGAGTHHSAVGSGQNSSASGAQAHPVQTGEVSRVVDVRSPEALEDLLQAHGGTLTLLLVHSAAVIETGEVEVAELHWRLDVKKVAERRRQELQHLRAAFGRLSETCGGDADVVFASVDADSPGVSDLCRQLNVTTFPSLLFFRNGTKLLEHKGMANMEARMAEGVLFHSGALGSNVRAWDHISQLRSAGDHSAFVARQRPQVLSVVHFSLSDSLPCMQVFPALLALAKNFDGYAAFARVLGDEGPEAARLMASLNVTWAPTFVFYRNGKEVGRHVGSARADLIGKILQLQSDAGVAPPQPASQAGQQPPTRRVVQRRTGHRSKKQPPPPMQDQPLPPAALPLLQPQRQVAPEPVAEAAVVGEARTTPVAGGASEHAPQPVQQVERDGQQQRRQDTSKETQATPGSAAQLPPPAHPAAAEPSGTLWMYRGAGELYRGVQHLYCSPAASSPGCSAGLAAGAQAGTSASVAPPTIAPCGPSHQPGVRLYRGAGALLRSRDAGTSEPPGTSEHPASVPVAALPALPSNDAAPLSGAPPTAAATPPQRIRAERKQRAANGFGSPSGAGAGEAATPSKASARRKAKGQQARPRRKGRK